MAREISRLLAGAGRCVEGFAEGHGPMSDTDAEVEANDVVLDVELDAPPEKVWRAVSIPELREKWLPGADLANADPISSEPGEEIRYRMRDDEPPFLESEVT